MSQSDFMAKLYAIKPFRNVDSPPQLSANLEQQQGHLEQQPAHFDQQLICLDPMPHQLQMPVPMSALEGASADIAKMNSISNTIDLLFSKIQKIKSEFDSPFLSTQSQSQHLHEQPQPQPLTCDYSELAEELARLLQPMALGELSGNQLAAKGEDNIQIKGLQRSQLAVQPTTARPKEVQIREFELGRSLGAGKFGEVVVGRHRASGSIFAVKKILKSTIKEYDMQQQFARELRIHYGLDHPNIVPLYGHFQDDYHVFLLLECAQATLIDSLSQGEQFASRIVAQTLRAVEHLAAKQIVHRDIKPENIVLCGGGTHPVAKLCDFGWAAPVVDRMRTTFCGTLDYVSPEMKDVGHYSLSVDLWSVGVLAFELLAGFPPYKQQIAQWKQLGSRRQQKWAWQVLFPPHFSSVACEFILGLLTEDPLLRKSIPACLASLFILAHA